MEKSLIKNADELVHCAIFRHEPNCRQYYAYESVYRLFKIVGAPGDRDKAECYPFTRPVFGMDGDGFFYDPEYGKPEDWEAWKIPRWAVNHAMEIIRMIKKSYDIGVEEGYERGLKDGKNFVTRLAAGSMSIDGFDMADGRNERRLTPKKWSD